VLTANGFVVVEDDQFTVTNADTGAVIEGGVILDPTNQVIFKGSAEERQLGRDAEILTLDGLDDAAAALNQFDDGDFADIELVG